MLYTLSTDALQMLFIWSTLGYLASTPLLGLSSTPLVYPCSTLAAFAVSGLLLYSSFGLVLVPTGYIYMQSMSRWCGLSPTVLVCAWRSSVLASPAEAIRGEIGLETQPRGYVGLFLLVCVSFGNILPCFGGVVVSDKCVVKLCRL